MGGGGSGGVADHVRPPLLNHWWGSEGRWRASYTHMVCTLCSKEHRLIIDLSVKLLLFTYINVLYE